MRVLLIAATTAALVGGASLAFAASANSTVGVIKSLNPAKDTVTLDNGATYWAPKTMDLSKFKVGEKVAITYGHAKGKMANGPREIETLTPAT